MVLGEGVEALENTYITLHIHTVFHATHLQRHQKRRTAFFKKFITDFH